MAESSADARLERRDAFEAALNNHYFILQSSRGNAVAESGTRASLYVMSLSSALVAIGFVVQSRSALGPFLSVVLPTLFVLGLFTIVRLVDTGVENRDCLQAMERIRRYYAELAPEAPSSFSTIPTPALQCRPSWPAAGASASVCLLSPAWSRCSMAS